MDPVFIPHDQMNKLQEQLLATQQELEIITAQLHVRDLQMNKLQRENAVLRRKNAEYQQEISKLTALSCPERYNLNCMELNCKLKMIVLI